MYRKTRMEYHWNHECQNTEIFRRKPVLPAKSTSALLRFNLVNQSRSLCLVTQAIDHFYEISSERKGCNGKVICLHVSWLNCIKDFNETCYWGPHLKFIYKLDFGVYQSDITLILQEAQFQLKHYLLYIILVFDMLHEICNSLCVLVLFGTFLFSMVFNEILFKIISGLGECNL